jgi:lathosterol oxidase
MLTFIILSIVMTTRYLVSSSLFYRFVRREDHSPIGPDIRSSILSSIIFAFFGAVAIHLWEEGATKIYMEFNDYPFWYIPVSFLLYLFLHDTYFYWSHRLLHRYKFQRCHVVHHRARVPTAWTSFAFHPFEATLQAMIIPALTLLIPIHWSVLVLILTIMSLFGLTNHLGKEIYPAWAENKLTLITANHHQAHHENLKRNFGLYFTWWDHLMKTEYKKDEL